MSVNFEYPLTVALTMVDFEDAENDAIAETQYDPSNISRYQESRLRPLIWFGLKTRAWAQAYRSDEVRWLLKQDYDFDVQLEGAEMVASSSTGLRIKIVIPDDKAAMHFKLTFQ